MKQEPSKIETLKNEVYSREQYSKGNFWDERYAQNSGFFDWYAEYPELKHAFAEYDIKKSDKILMVGCGNSKLSHQMWQAGYKEIVNIDISPSVIEQMKKQFPQLHWEVMDATKMSFPDGHFDVVLDKGTLDALISGKNYDICFEMLKQCMRVTQQNGQLILITYGSPQGRKRIFQPALPFSEYDYYQCRAQLNDMSTMINLMRGNLGGRALNHIVKDKEAMSKTMKEFSIVKMLRRRRVNKKQYILWNGMQKKQVQVNPTYVKSQEKQQSEKQQSVEAKKEEKKEETFSYEPKKQSYVYVYSIRRQFACQLQKLLSQVTDDQLLQTYNADSNKQCIVQGSSSLQPVTIFTEKSCYASFLRASQFLKKKKVPHPTFALAQNEQQALKKSMRMNLIASNQTKQSFLALRKTNLGLQIKLNQRITTSVILKQLQKLSPKLVSLCDLYPCPKTYAMFSILKTRNEIKNVNALMQKYWFPTFKLESASETCLTIKMSLPPVNREKEDSIVQTMKKLLKGVAWQVTERQQGFLSYFDLQLYNIVGMACLSYSNKMFNLILQDFWNSDVISESIVPSRHVNNQLYIELYNTVILPKDIISKVMSHVFAFY